MFRVFIIISQMSPNRLRQICIAAILWIPFLYSVIKKLFVVHPSVIKKLFSGYLFYKHQVIVEKPIREIGPIGTNISFVL